LEPETLITDEVLAVGDAEYASILQEFSQKVETIRVCEHR
jgi:ABC-type polysaccharide/polyol phosphate transport system ATPase subunit